MEYAQRGWSALVTVDAQFVRVLALSEHGLDPKTYVLGLLQSGFLTDALPMLEALDAMLSDVDVAYNHGLCLSELGRPEEAITLLERALALDPTHKDAAIALGVAHARLEHYDEAAAVLSQVVQRTPDDALAKRNLAAVLMRGGKPQRRPLPTSDRPRAWRRATPVRCLALHSVLRNWVGKPTSPRRPPLTVRFESALSITR